MTHLDLANARALADAATPGAWTHGNGYVTQTATDDRADVVVDNEMLEADAAFIAAARSLVPALIVECERLGKELDEMRARYEKAHADCKRMIALNDELTAVHAAAIELRAAEKDLDKPEILDDKMRLRKHERRGAAVSALIAAVDSVEDQPVFEDGRTLAEVRADGARVRYFADHGVVHDRETSKHVYAEECAAEMNRLTTLRSSGKGDGNG